MADDNIDRTAGMALNSLRTDFLLLLRGESAGYSSFLTACSNFDSFIRSCSGSLKAETLDAISTFTAPLGLMSSTLAEVDSEKNLVTSRFSTEVLDILSDKTEHLSIVGPDCNERPSCPHYVQASARWLKDNWCNPYPSIQVRTSIAQDTSTSRKDVDAWFIDARKRIGWNELRRKHFDNKRANIVDAAIAFECSDRVLPIEPIAENINIQFALIKGHAAFLYDEKFSESNLAQKLDVAVKDMTPGLKEQIKADRQRQKLERHRKRERFSSYPTPERSLRSVYPDLASSPPPQGLSSEPTSSRKRSLDEDDDPSARPNKRARNVLPTIKPSVKAAIGLPSPASSAADELASAPSSPQTGSFPSQTSPTVAVPSGSSSNKRKRCLSDGFQSPGAKRLRPRPQAVSDPLPSFALSDDLAAWFSLNLPAGIPVPSTLPSDMSAIPPPVTFEVPNLDIPLELEMPNFPAIANFPSTSNDPLTCISVASLNQSITSDSFDEPLQDFGDHVNQSSISFSHIFDSIFAVDKQQQSEASQEAILLGDHSYMLDWTQDLPSFDIPGFSDSTNSVPVTVPDIPSTGTLFHHVTEAEREHMQRELDELEARARFIRAEMALSAVS
ncbi:mating-type protein [Coprinopsis marcescibilis]|uniref:Mating-type protein n=1 Tax=Coprinopsis marcescibilis TaxID=230819 RepID=A0A5C3LQ82_COPMA|nr:mating-type protein [Coprinopsis marcescibilis]